MLLLLALQCSPRTLCICCYCILRKRELLRRWCDCNCYAAIATPTSSFATIAATNALWILRVEGDTATLKLLLLTSFAAVATAIAYADGSVARVTLLTAVIVRMLSLHFQKAITATQMLLLQLLCCYCYSDIEFCYNCYYKRAIAISRTRRHCYAATATANEFCCSC